MLPSGPGGVRRFSLRGAQPSTPSHEAHSTRPALGRGFDPAEADCGLQGTANSPSSTATSKQEWRRGWDLNPRHRGSPRARHFQCRTFGRSVTPPGSRRKNWRRGEDLNPRGTFWAPIRFRVGRLQPGSATPPRTQRRLVSKNPRSSAALSASSTPPTADTRWFRRASSSSRCSDSTAPAFGSSAPYTTRARRA